MIRGNVVHQASSGSFHRHDGKDNRIANTMLASACGWQLQRTPVEDHVSFRFERDVVWWDSDTPLAKGDWNGGIVARSTAAVGRKTPRVVSPDRRSVPTPWPAARALAAEGGGVDAMEPLIEDSDGGGEVR